MLCDYGRFCLRAGALVRGEECFRRALESDAAHPGALLGLLCLELEAARAEAAAGGGSGFAAARRFEAAEVLGHALKDMAVSEAAAAAAAGAQGHPAAPAQRQQAAGAGPGPGPGRVALAWALLSVTYREQGEPAMSPAVPPFTPGQRAAWMPHCIAT